MFDMDILTIVAEDDQLTCCLVQCYQMLIVWACHYVGQLLTHLAFGDDRLTRDVQDRDGAGPMIRDVDPIAGGGQGNRSARVDSVRLTTSQWKCAQQYGEQWRE
jgi:hypothetical protein